MSDNAHPINVVIVYNGITKPLRVEPAISVASLLSQAIAQFTITEPQHLLALFDRDNRELTPEDQTLAQAGLASGTRLVLRPSTVKGGR